MFLTVRAEFAMIFREGAAEKERGCPRGTEPMNIDPIVEKIHRCVRKHELGAGAYARYTRPDEAKGRTVEVNPYGCADAANLLYTIGNFERDPQRRAESIAVMQAMQDPETGLFHESTHHPIHTTAHVLAALELFDAGPLHPAYALEEYRDISKMRAFLDALDWEGEPWGQSHRGAGLYAALRLTGRIDTAWQDAYFGWLRENCDERTGIGRRREKDCVELPRHLYGWFHYLFCHADAHRPFPYPEKLIDSCLDLYENHREQMGKGFGKMCSFREVDWVFSLNRVLRQCPHRFDEGKVALRDFAKGFTAYLLRADEETDESLDDLHTLFGAACALAELQQALPGEMNSTVPLRLVLDRRPFI